MSFEPDNPSESQNEQSERREIIKLLKQCVFLLETIANFEQGTSEDFIQDD
jgi:hypothetical protein